jgi:hypothetical protein
MDDRTDPRCPECGGPIGATATYCMHCSADLTDEQQAADIDGDETWDAAGAGVADAVSSTVETVTDAGGDATAGDAPRSDTAGGTGGGSGQLLDPDGLADNALTVVVGIAGGIVVGLVGTIVLGVVTDSGYGVLFGIVTWLVATAYLVRRRTVQGAVSKAGYAVALVLLSVPLIALSPFVTVDGGLSGRGGLFVVLLVFVVVPAGIAATVGWVAGRFVPEGAGSEG